MKEDLQFWRVWAAALQRLGIQEPIATILEAAGPLTLLGSQMLYIGQPLLQTLSPHNSTIPQIEALARLLEEPRQTRLFAAYLREEISS